WFTPCAGGGVHADGRLSRTARADEMTNPGGQKVPPSKMAAILEPCPAVREAAVFGEPDSQYGQRVTAVVVPASHSAPPGLGELRAAVRRKLPAYAAPRALLIVPSIPLLPSGNPHLAPLPPPTTHTPTPP